MLWAQIVIVVAISSRLGAWLYKDATTSKDTKEKCQSVAASFIVFAIWVAVLAYAGAFNLIIHWPN